MSAPSVSPAAGRSDEPIVVDDDDDVQVALPFASHALAPSPSLSLREVTPAMSVATASTSNGNQLNELDVRHVGGQNGTSESPLSLDRYRTGYVYSSEMMLHVNPIDPDHPERPLRVFKIFLKLKEKNVLSHMKRIPIREVTEDEVKLVHDRGIWEGVQRLDAYHPDILKEQVLMLETTSSLYINEHTPYVARLSCGGAIELVDAVASGRIQNGFAIVRPPGHHAEPHKSMGFCFFNNVAVATREVTRRHDHINKVLILDWDVHHGNGTQRAFEDDPNVLYISLHRYDEDGSFYPGSTYGNFDSTGTGHGEGKSVNVPWPIQGMGDADYMYAFHHLVMPIAHEFDPDLVIISAGFDAADGDPIGLNRVSPGGFAQMTHQLTSLCKGKVAVVLEGGYNPDAVANSAVAVTEVLLGEPAAEPHDTIASTIAALTVNRVRRHHKKWWKSLRVPQIEADDVDAQLAPRAVDVAHLLAAYRTQVVAAAYDLFEVPLHSTPHKQFQGHILCSEEIFTKFPAILFFVHDMGNWRSERSKSSSDEQQTALQLVDASRSIIDYARERGFGLVDVNLMREFATERPRPSIGVKQTSRGNEPAQLEAAKAAAFIWDNIVALAGKPVVMVGFGSGCSALTAVMDERDVESHVKAIVNVVGYNDMPSVSLQLTADRKKWYYKKSMVLAPADHRHLIERGDAAPLKRFGKITPIHDTEAINIFTKRIDDIKNFIDKKLAPTRRPTVV